MRFQNMIRGNGRIMMLLRNKLLKNNATVLTLLEHNPFEATPPRAVKITLYRYEFVNPGGSGWWRRERLDVFVPPISANEAELQNYLRHHGLLSP
mgnify:CR=1 FL=1